MATVPIERVESWQVDLAPKVVRTDAIQSFVTQETPLVRITCSDGAQGVGYTYTIGTGGSSVVALLRDHLCPRLIGRDAAEIEGLWKDLFFHTHATSVGAITSLALAAIDTALWDLRCRRANLPPAVPRIHARSTPRKEDGCTSSLRRSSMMLLPPGLRASVEPRSRSDVLTSPKMSNAFQRCARRWVTIGTS